MTEEVNNDLVAEATVSSEEDGESVDSLSDEEKLRLVLDELETLREENEQLRQDNLRLTSANSSQHERLRQVILGRERPTVTEVEKEIEESKYNVYDVLKQDLIF